ncbi:MAG TPA: exo-beta-N-acetylmuramidase NamZ domain-containing protein [Thermoanaerobaculia bacterium]|nr:exo-beta-N-acetylmuramidase NamZ domain-containing protein [Thermoanaerobaculia bacterium]
MNDHRTPLKRRPWRRFVFLSLLAASCATAPAPGRFRADKLRQIDAAVEEAIAGRRIPGGVIWIERDGAVHHRAWGNRSIVPVVAPMTKDTIFDVASITKVVATTPAIWILIERGKVGLDEPVWKYIPEFRGGWKDEITVRHLLTHTGGLRPDLDLDEPWSGADTAFRLTMEETIRNRPGYTFRYSDIGFLLLGWIVERVSGQPLDEFTRREIFEPLGMRDTGFRRLTGRSTPPPERIAPTESVPCEPGSSERCLLHGAVHDPTARRMGGVAGHAGLFTTARDLARYARMILAGGETIMKPETVRMMTSVQSPPNVAVKRAGGFDLDSGFSRPRGDVFPVGSFGHTGWTGGFFWIDPSSRTFYVFLSNRVHPEGRGSVLALQRTIGTLAAEAAGVSPGTSRGRFPHTISWVTGGADTANGIDVLHAQQYRPLRGMKIGLITNHTGNDRAGNPTIDLLRSAPDVHLVALFSPEHGIRGTADEKVGDTTDPVSGLPVYSLYGERRKPSPEQLAGLDALVFDIQDIGTRFYTYISTMGLAMEAAAEANIRFFVLDRVNPIGGTAFEGPVAEGDSTFVAFHPISIRHGMTVGEIAQMFNDERGIHARLEVIRMRGWKREFWQDEAGLAWIDTSPNMRSLAAAALYPGIGILESAISVGRGTPTPFEVAGAPYIDPDRLAREMNALALPGIRFEPVRFTPNASVFKDQPCGGLRFVLTDRKAFQPVRTGIALAVTLRRLHPESFELDKMKHLLKHGATLEAIRAGKPFQDVISLWNEEEKAFGERRAKYLLY